MTSLMRSTRVLLLACLALSGCLTFDGVLKPDGSGTVDMTYTLPQGTDEAKEKASHSSDHVTLESFTMSDDKKSATAKLKVDDVTKLSTAEAFKDVVVKRTNEGSDEILSITINNPKPLNIADKSKPGPKINLTLPGAVREANRDGKVSDNKVSWSFTLADFAKEKSLELTVRYAAAEAKDAAAKPAAATQDAGKGKEKPAAK